MRGRAEARRRPGIGLPGGRLIPPLAMLALAGCTDRAGPSGELRPPARVIVIGVDTLRADHLSGYGYSRPTTPILDRLAAREAVVFERAYAAAPWTLPSMASIFTSLYPLQHRTVDRGFRLDPSLPTLASTFSEAGWSTAAFVTHIYVSSLFGLDRGFGEFRELSIDWSFAEGHQLTADALNAAVFPWLEEHAGERFFLYLHYFDPHWDYAPPPPWNRRFTDPDYRGDATGRWRYLKEFLPRDRRMAAADLRHVIDLYDGEIAWTDHELGRLFDHLGQLGLWEDSLLAVVSDHGEELQDHGSMHHIRTLYEEVLRVPLLLKLPGGRAPHIRRRIPERVRTVDLAPGLLELAGIPPPRSFAGESLVPLLTAAGSDRPVFAHTQRHRSDKATLLAGDTKVILGWARGEERTELYRPREDPAEQRDLAQEEPDETARARAELLRWMREMRRFQATPDQEVALTPEQEENLRALGYLQDDPD